MPAATRISRCRRRNAATRSATRRPASAKNSKGSAAPTANDSVSAMVDRPMVPVAPAMTMAARTGPAHGTYSTPSAKPSPKPLLPEPNCFCGSRENGFSNTASNCGKIRPMPMATSATSATHRIASCGRRSSDSRAEPTSVTTLKLSTKPAMTRYGRSASDSERLVLTAVATPPPASAGFSERALWVPEKKITGRTGRMHGEIPVIKPPMKPIRTSVSMPVIRSRNGFGCYQLLTRQHKGPETPWAGPGAFASTDVGLRPSWPAASAPCRSCTRSRWR